MPVINFHAGLWDAARAETFLAIPLVDMVLFGGVFAAAIAYRHRPEIHKRLMIVAAVAIMFAAVGRATVNAGLLVGDAGAFAGTPLRFVLWYLPLIVAMGHELVTRRRIRFMAKEELFAKPWLARLLTALGGFPVSRGSADRAALRTAPTVAVVGDIKKAPNAQMIARRLVGV